MAVNLVFGTRQELETFVCARSDFFFIFIFLHIYLTTQSVSLLSGMNNNSREQSLTVTTSLRTLSEASFSLPNYTY